MQLLNILIFNFLIYINLSAKNSANSIMLTILGLVWLCMMVLTVGKDSVVFCLTGLGYLLLLPLGISKLKLVEERASHVPVFAEMTLPTQNYHCLNF